MKAVIVVPTFCEQQNIGRLIDALEAVFKRMAHDMHILVVDDSSPDGTIDVVKACQRQYKNVHAIQGIRIGLGAAYVRGMTHAMEYLQADVVYEMDADLSHKPEDVPRLMVALEEGADIAIGSRYVSGGSIPREWGIHRKVNSVIGNLVARYMTGMHAIRDCTAGFRAIRVPALRKIDFDSLNVQGYAFQVTLLHAAVSTGAKVVEVPVDFIERTAGESKLGLRDIVEFILNVSWIRFQNSKTFIKFVTVGATGIAVNLGAFTLLLATGVNKFVASPIAIELSIVSNFMMNNYWTFRGRNMQSRTRVRGLKFNAVSLLALAISYGVFVLLSVATPTLPPQLPQLAGIVPATLVNYFLNSYWTFKASDS
jgi:dolichol-phosphate mannosyltransferase